MVFDQDIVIRLLISAVLGGIIGYERQARNKSAGLRTHILVSLGACLIMILSINLYSSVQGLTNADPARLAAQVVSGIGFLGAGAIITKRGTITGLTTAASLWVVAGVGLAVGAGSFIGAFTTTGIVFLTLHILSRFEGAIREKSCSANLAIVMINKPGQIGKVGACLGDAGIEIHDITVDNAGNDERIEIMVCLNLPPQGTIGEVITNLLSIEGIISVHNR